MMPDGSQSDLLSDAHLVDLRDYPEGGTASHRPSPDILRVLVIGTPQVVNTFVMTLFRYSYARPDEWSRQLPTVNPGEVMRILAKRTAPFEEGRS